MTLSRLAILLLILLWAATSLQAGPVPGRWEKVETLRPGTPLFVVLRSGDKLEATLREVRNDGFVVQRSDGSVLQLPKDSVRKVVLPGSKEHDQVWNGLAIGAAAGAGTFLLVHAGLAGANYGAHDIAGVVFGAAIGMGVGALLDASVKRTEVVYQAR